MTWLYSEWMKTAVSIPDRVFREADLVAARRGISRSELYAQALRELLERDRTDDVTERLDAVYRDLEPGEHADPVLLASSADRVATAEW